MATENNSAAPPLDAFEVGTAFTTLYYTLMHTQPQEVHRLFVDSSKLTRADQLASPGETVTTMQGIHNKVMSLNSPSVKTEIKSVDCQESLTGSILVLVTGSQSHPSWEQPRFFVQSFFLVPQEHGYYVNNDIFRFTDDAPPQMQPAIEKHALHGEKAAEITESAGSVDSILPNGDAGHSGVTGVLEQEDIVRDVTVDEASQSKVKEQVEPHPSFPLAANGPVASPYQQPDASSFVPPAAVPTPDELLGPSVAAQGEVAAEPAGAAPAPASAAQQPSVLPTPPTAAGPLLAAAAAGSAEAVSVGQAPAAASPAPPAPVLPPAGAAAGAAGSLASAVMFGGAPATAFAQAPVQPPAPAAAAAASVAAGATASAAGDDSAPKKSYASILQAIRAQASAAGASAAAASSAAVPLGAPAVAHASSSAPLLPAAPHQQPGTALPASSAVGAGAPAPPPLSSQAPVPLDAAPPAPLPAPAATPAASPAAVDGGSAAGPDGVPPPGPAEPSEGRSVFVRNLPLTVTAREIAEHMAQFGAVRADRIQIRSNKVCLKAPEQIRRNKQANPSTVFAFVEFEEAAAAQQAIAKQTIQVHSFLVKIERKTSSSTGGAGDRNRAGFRRPGGAGGPAGGVGRSFRGSSGAGSGSGSGGGGAAAGAAGANGEGSRGKGGSRSGPAAGHAGGEQLASGGDGGSAGAGGVVREAGAQGGRGGGWRGGRRGGGPRQGGGQAGGRGSTPAGVAA